jgi:hypothetical protein
MLFDFLATHLLESTVKRALKIIGGIIGIVLILVIAASVYVLAVWNRTIDRAAPTMTARGDSAAEAPRARQHSSNSQTTEARLMAGF